MCDCFPSINAGSGFSCYASISPPLFLGPAAEYVSVLVVQYSLWLGAHIGKWGMGRGRTHSAMVGEGSQAPW